MVYYISKSSREDILSQLWAVKAGRNCLLVHLFHDALRHSVTSAATYLTRAALLSSPPSPQLPLISWISLLICFRAAKVHHSSQAVLYRVSLWLAHFGVRDAEGRPEKWNANEFREKSAVKLQMIQEGEWLFCWTYLGSVVSISRLAKSWPSAFVAL